MRYILASNNKGKLKEMKAILANLGAEVISQSEAGLSIDADETGTTFEENALIKAKAACEAIREPAIADDSGLAVEALGGAPGVYSARYGGCATDEERVNLLLKNLEGEKNRRAKFVSCIACTFPNGDVITARGECEGVITLAPRGEGGFGYDPIFELLDTGKTMAELSDEEKNAVSHRGRALKIFEMKLREYNADK
ncbi:MAG: non-canonical purine NTP pyrophosphatase [Firmicutes bacterium HGW-Firmicutes-16]|nr:MAG: non-canonical purine NTP pyrophosphatase [Firmicutes bacterium HGW-Firmicutes-16]